MEWSMVQPFILPIIGSIATYVVLVKKLEFEIQQLRKDTDRQETEIKTNAQAIADVKEHGTTPSAHLDKRVEKMEEEFADMKRTLDDMRQTLTRNESAMTEIKGSLSEIKSFMNTSVERRTRGRKQ
jgi:chromosome segregation ATPase